MHGIEFDRIPPWQKYGVGLFWRYVEKLGYNPKTCENVIAKRRELHVEYDLPTRDVYGELIEKLCLQM